MIGGPQRICPNTGRALRLKQLPGGQCQTQHVSHCISRTFSGPLCCMQGKQPFADVDTGAIRELVASGYELPLPLQLPWGKQALDKLYSIAEKCLTRDPAGRCAGGGLS